MEIKTDKSISDLLEKYMMINMECGKMKIFL